MLIAVDDVDVFMGVGVGVESVQRHEAAAGICLIEIDHFTPTLSANHRRRRRRLASPRDPAALRSFDKRKVATTTPGVIIATAPP